MYNKFHKGELIKSETTIDSTFPANREIELWKNTELKRFEVLERPVISLFENDVEHERFVQDLIKGLYLGRDIDDSKNFNSILYGCELDKETLTNGDVYTTLTPGIFIYENKVYQIYPTCYIASRQLEKEAELTTENGLEYINIKYENEKFSADIKVGSYPKEKISGDITRGIVLLEKIKTYLDGKIAYRHSGHEVPEVINISTSLEKFQLEPVFKSTTTKRWVRFDHQNKEIQNGNKGSGEFLFGGHSSDGALDFKDIVKWDGFITRAYKENSITNDKLAKIPAMTVKGNDTNSEREVKDVARDDLVNNFKLVSWNNSQTISSIKTFTEDQIIDQSKKLIFKKNEEAHGWNINKNNSNSLIIEKGGATPKTILAIEDDEDIIFNVKDFTITSTNDINITGKTNVIGDTDITGSLDVSVDAGISGDLSVTGSTTITGKTTLEDKLEVTGTTNLKSTLDVTGKTILRDELEVTKATNLKSTLDVTGKTTLKNKLEVSGTTLLKDDLTVDTGKDTTLGGELSVTGNTSITGTLGITGATSLSTLGTSGLATLNSLSVTGSTTLTGTLGVTGATSLSTLGTSGLATLSSLSVTNNTSLEGTLGVTGATTLSSTLGVTGDTSLTALETSELATLSSLKVTGTSTLEGNLVIGNSKFTVNSPNGNTSLEGTLGVTGSITAKAGIISNEDITTITDKDITSGGNITSSKNITLGGDLTFNKRNFTINLGKDGGSYDWVIKKTEANGTGTLKITGGGETTSINNGGLLKAKKFATNIDYELNELNVEKFNGHTITTSGPSEETLLSNVNDIILWKSPGVSGTVIKKVAFKNLPKANEDTSEDGLMTAENLGRITNLETYAGWVEGDGTFLIGEVNGEKTLTGGGSVSIDSKIINIDDLEVVSPGTSKETVHTRLLYNAGELTRIAGHLPTGTVTSENNRVMLKDGLGISWGQITDNQISSTITKVSPVTAPTNKEEYGIAFWNAGANRLHRDMDVSYDPGNDTLTATNVTSRSSRKLKKDIEVYTESAFNTLDKIEVVSFHFIGDETQADKVGFIAEDSPTLVAGLNHDKMDMNNCIGLLIKAVQELREENKELRNELNNIRNS